MNSLEYRRREAQSPKNLSIDERNFDSYNADKMGTCHESHLAGGSLKFPTATRYDDYRKASLTAREGPDASSTNEEEAWWATLGGSEFPPDLHQLVHRTMQSVGLILLTVSSIQSNLWLRWTYIASVERYLLLKLRVKLVENLTSAKICDLSNSLTRRGLSSYLTTAGIRSSAKLRPYNTCSRSFGCRKNSRPETLLSQSVKAEFNSVTMRAL